jgi:phosphoenolpyruvate carboxykinase (GTP)
MLIPTLPGWKVETVGDDISWMKFGKDGRLYAINPEAGFFGVAPGTSLDSNPNAMHSCEKNTIFTNVALTDDGDVWWEGIGTKAPDHLIDWKGKDWTPDSKEVAAHANSRFTAPAKQCPVISPEWENPEGVPISAILIGGRRPSTIPLVHQSLDWNHGIFLGSIMGSEITAATISKNIGQVRRDPFAMLPFIGYNVSDYLQHWLDIGTKSEPDKLPKIFYVNWFRKDANGKWLWPGFGENSRVLKWVCERVAGEGKAVKTPIGYMPTTDAIDTNGLDVSAADMAELLKVNKEEWLKEVESIKEHYAKFGDKLPKEMTKQLAALEERLKA